MSWLSHEMLPGWRARTGRLSLVFVRAKRPILLGWLVWGFDGLQFGWDCMQATQGEVELRLMCRG